MTPETDPLCVCMLACVHMKWKRGANASGAEKVSTEGNEHTRDGQSSVIYRHAEVTLAHSLLEQGVYCEAFPH